MCEKFKLERFLKVQKNMYEIALLEMKNGKKLSHWMWYIFPQIEGLGRSYKARFYAIKGLEEAKCYLKHEILEERLLEISNVVLNLENKSIDSIFGFPDNLKFHSSITLFSLVSEDFVFDKLLDKYFNRKMDEKTLKIIANLF